ncbi:hypothetical protein OG223_27540 [Streptomyces sp. NBC_01478]|uniref:hypothetical protein n=1 Tax=Streptomyces sp. NBC_01478 TaxID=2903882 RepID=UPI002E30F9E8|nr:hypothetical protein [Streptomyces sp. NBC_01478]
MTSTPTTTTGTSDDVAELVALQRELGPWALLAWRPRGGFTDPDTVDLRAVKAGLRRLIA